MAEKKVTTHLDFLGNEIRSAKLGTDLDGNGYFFLGRAHNLRTFDPESASFRFRQAADGTLPKDIDAAVIQKIIGNTVTWNQIMPLPNSNLTTNGVTFTANEDGSYTVNGTASANANYTIKGGFQSLLVVGHKYLFHLSGNTKTKLRDTYSGNINLSSSSIWTCTNVSSSFTLALSVLQGNTAANERVYTFCVDLTQMFGDGNEPTLEEFEHLYPVFSPDYSTGQIRNNEVCALESSGFNQWDEEWEAGGYGLSTGEKTVSVGYIRSVNAIKVLSGVNYYIKKPATFPMRVLQYDSLGNYLGYLSPTTAVSGEVLSFVENTAYIRFHIYLTTYNHDICINISDPAKNGTYEPYKGYRLSLPLTSLKGRPNGTGAEETIFPNGPAGVNDVRDEVYRDKSVRKLGRVNLYSLTYSRGLYTSQYGFSAKFPHMKGMNARVSSPKYKIVSDTAVANAPDMSIMLNANNTNIYIVNNSKTTVAELLEDLKDVVLVYELETPQIFIHKEPLDFGYSVDPLGTECVETLDPEVPSAPFMAEIQYGASAGDMIKKPRHGVLMSKTYNGTDFAGTSDNYEQMSRYFMSVKPNAANEFWRVRFRVRVWIPIDSSKRFTDSVIEYSGYGVTLSDYWIWNTLGNTYAAYYQTNYWLAAAGLNAGYGHAIGTSMYSGGTNRTNLAWYRNVRVDVLDYEGCEVTLMDSLKKWSEWEGGNATNYARGGTTPSTYNATTRGMTMSGDRDTAYQTYDNKAYKAGDTAIPAYNPIGENKDGQLVPMLSKPFLVWGPMYLCSAAIAAGSASSGLGLYHTIGNYQIRNGSAYVEGVVYKPLYLKGTISDGLFSADATTPYVTALPSTDDGFYYYYLGETTASTASSKYTYLSIKQGVHPIYFFKDGEVRVYPWDNPDRTLVYETEATENMIHQVFRTGLLVGGGQKSFLVEMSVPVTGARRVMLLMLNGGKLAGDDFSTVKLDIRTLLNEGSVSFYECVFGIYEGLELYLDLKNTLASSSNNPTLKTKVTPLDDTEIEKLESQPSNILGSTSGKEYLTSSSLPANLERTTNKVTSISSSSTDVQYPSAKLLWDSLQGKQDTLVSGTNIKTINNTSLLGEGNLGLVDLDSAQTITGLKTFSNTTKTKHLVVHGASTANDTRLISSSGASDLYVSIGGTISLVVEAGVVRRGASASSVDLGATTAPWRNAYAQTMYATGKNLYVGMTSGIRCHQQYDEANKCLKFIFD